MPKNRTILVPFRATNVDSKRHGKECPSDTEIQVAALSTYRDRMFDTNNKCTCWQHELFRITLAKFGTFFTNNSQFQDFDLQA